MKKTISVLLLLTLLLCARPGCARLDTTGLLEAAPALIREADA